MSLTYREEKGSALTIEELDNNFRYFTGSHSITGSLTLSGSIIPSEVNATLGTAENPWKELFVSADSIKFISGSTTASISMNAQGDIVTPVETASYADEAGHALIATTASYALNFNPSATSSYAVNALSASYAPNFVNTDLTLTENRTHTLNGNTLTFNASQDETFHISSSTGGEVLISGLPTQTKEYIVGYNPVDGALYAMPTSSIAGGGGSAFPYTGSAGISGSLEVDGKILNDFPQVHLYPTGSDISDALELQLGAVNIIHGSGSVKLPDPVYGRIVRVVASQGIGQFPSNLSIYPSSTSGSFSQNPTGSATNIPVNNLMYKFECIQNPSPGVWVLVQQSNTYLEKTYFYPMYYDTNGSGSSATYETGVAQLNGYVGSMPYSLEYTAWAGTDPSVIAAQPPIYSSSSYSSQKYIDWGADVANFTDVQLKNFRIYTNITASGYPWTVGQAVTLENPNFAQTGSYSTLLKFGDANTDFQIIHSSYAGYAPPSPYSSYYSSNSWGTSWSFLNNPPSVNVPVDYLVNNPYGAAYTADSVNTVSGYTGPYQPISALPGDVAQYMSYQTNGTTPILQGTPVFSVGYYGSFGNLNTWKALRNTSGLIPKFTDTRIKDYVDGLVGVPVTLNNVSAGTYDSSTYSYLSSQYGIQSITVSSTAITAIRWTNNDCYKFYLQTQPSAGGGAAPAPGDSLTIVLNPFNPSDNIVIGPLTASDFYQKDWSISSKTGDIVTFFGAKMDWNSTAASATKAYWDGVGGRLRIEAVARATFAFM